MKSIFVGSGGNFYDGGGSGSDFFKCCNVM